MPQTYSQLVHHLFTLTNVGMKLGLETMQKLCSLYYNPQNSFKTVHVAGTNGKGSITTKISIALQDAGYRVGLYTSPHISSFRERIRINQKKIDEQSVTIILTDILEKIHKAHIQATFFEITTLLSFIYFAQQKVDVAVLETGLGGRLDATNVVNPLLSIVTSISLEHTEILGETIEQITKEKAGIIKRNVPVVIGPHVQVDIINEIGRNLHAEIHQVLGNFKTYDEENNAIARKALELLMNNYRVDESNITHGLSNRPPCRFEVLKDYPVVLDVAHNPDGFKQLLHFVEEHFPNRKLRFVIGISKSKDVEGCLKILRDVKSDIHFICGSNGRGMPVDDLVEIGEKVGIDKKRLLTEPSLEKNVMTAIEKAKKNDELVVICGSFFIMQQVRKCLGLHDEKDALDLNEK